MLAFIGFLIVCLFAIGATLLFVFSAAMGGSDLGPPKGKQWFGPLFIFCVAAGLWYLAYTESPFSVTFKG